MVVVPWFMLYTTKTFVMVGIIVFNLFLLDIMIYNISHLLRIWRIHKGKRIVELKTNPPTCSIEKKEKLLSHLQLFMFKNFGFYEKELVPIWEWTLLPTLN
jgi:hypothetical protein